MQSGRGQAPPLQTPELFSQPPLGNDAKHVPQRGWFRDDALKIFNELTAYSKTMMLLSTYSAFLQWMQEHLLVCPSRKYLHIDCPGCGFQRSCMAILRGDLPGSLALYPATIPIFMLLLLTALHLKYQFPFGAVAIKYFQVIVAIVIVVFYIYKIIHLKIAD